MQAYFAPTFPPHSQKLATFCLKLSQGWIKSRQRGGSDDFVARLTMLELYALDQLLDFT